MVTILKRTFCILFSLIMIALTFPLVVSSANKFSYGIFEYTLSGSTVTITGITDKYYSGKLDIPDSIVGNTVKYIDFGAFSGCENITSLNIPASITYIAPYCFLHCYGINEITVDVNNPKYKSLNNCLIDKENKSIVIGSNNSTIPSDSSITKINDYAFYGLKGIKSFTIPRYIDNIGYCSLNCCENLESIIVEAGNPTYHSSGNCLIITEYKALSVGCKNSVIPNDGSVTAIFDGAFDHCKGLTNLYIPEYVTSITGEYGESAFAYCQNLSNITVDTNNKTYYSEGNCIISKNDKTLILGCNNSIIPTDGSVVTIGNYAFQGSGITSIDIPGSISTISWFGFLDCNKLKRVHVAEGLKEIGSAAFQDCVLLTNISIPDSVKLIYNDTFLNTGVYNDESNWENGILYIGNHLYSAKPDLSGTYAIKPGTKTITEYAFYHCQGITSVTLPSSISYIGDYAFYGCNQLASISMPDVVMNVGYQTFNDTAYYNDYSNWDSDVLYIGNKLIAANKYIWGNYSVKSGTVAITSYAFSDCEYLECINIPGSVKLIGKGAFNCCKRLTDITLPNSIAELGEAAFSYCSSLSDITLSNSIDIIDNSMFACCTALSEISIPSGVKTIGFGALYECSSLTNVKMPISVTNIKGYAFDSCDNLENIYYVGTSHQRSLIDIDFGNECLENAFWHYNSQPECTHSTTIIKNKITPTCLQEGYTGDIYCKNCGKLLWKGELVFEAEHDYVWVTEAMPTLYESGLKRKICKYCEDCIDEEYLPALCDIYDLDSICNSTDDIVVAHSYYGEQIEKLFIRNIKNIIDDKQINYDINILDKSTGDQIFLNESILVKIKIPADLNTHYLNVYTTKANGSKARVSVVVDDGNIYFEIDKSNTFSLIEKLCGDISGDGNLNNGDLVTLFQYLSGWGNEVNSKAVDINGDGKENNQDLVLLFQYLSGWDVEIF